MDTRKQVKDEERALLFKAAILGLAVNTEYESHGEVLYKDKPVRTRNQLAGYYGFETGGECYTKVIEPNQYGTDYFSVKGKEAYDLATKLDSYIPDSWRTSPGSSTENLVTPTGIIKSLGYAPPIKGAFTLAEVLVDLIGDVNNYGNQRFEDFAHDIQKQLDTFRKQYNLTPEQQKELQTKPVIKDNEGAWIIKNKYVDIVGLYSPRDIAVRFNIRDTDDQPYEDLVENLLDFIWTHTYQNSNPFVRSKDRVTVMYGVAQGNSSVYGTQYRLSKTGLKLFSWWWNTHAYSHIVNQEKRLFKLEEVVFQLSENYPLPSKLV